VELQVLDLSCEAAAWDGRLAGLSADLRDVYFGAGYHLIWQRNGDGAAYGAVFESSEGAVFYPFLARRLADVPALGDEWAGFLDITSAYGYGGPLVSTPDGRAADTDSRVRLLAGFRAAFSAWCRERQVVSEFVRFHPLLENEVGFLPRRTCCGAAAATRQDAPMEVVPANVTVWARLSTPEEHRRALSSSARRNLRKAERAGLTFQVETGDEAWTEFQRLYSATMRRRSAGDYYLFSPRYFDECRELLGGGAALLGVRRPSDPDAGTGELVAAALFLRSERWIHYHLGGSDSGALAERPNNLLFVGAMDWGASLGVAGMHLGGGVHDGGDDELLRFKAGFSPLRARFHLGRCIHLPDAYDAAVQRWHQRGGADPGGYFPAYRAPLPDPSGAALRAVGGEDADR